MTENNVSNHIPDNMDVVVVIDKEKLPEDVRKLLEENLPKDVLEQLKLSQEKVSNVLSVKSSPIRDKENKQDSPIQDNIDNKSGNKTKDILFAIQTGTVVGNIYDKNFKLDDTTK